jgi:hypothetical protein
VTNGGTTTNGCGSPCIFAICTPTVSPTPTVFRCLWQNWLRKAKRLHSRPRPNVRMKMTPCSCRRRCKRCETTMRSRHRAKRRSRWDVGKDAGEPQWSISRGGGTGACPRAGHWCERTDARGMATGGSAVDRCGGQAVVGRSGRQEIGVSGGAKPGVQRPADSVQIGVHKGARRSVGCATGEMLAVQFGKGGTPRTVPLPQKIHAAIMRQFETAGELHQEDMKPGYDGMFLPASFEKKARSAAREPVWQRTGRAAARWPRVWRAETRRHPAPAVRRGCWETPALRDGLAVHTAMRATR